MYTIHILEKPARPFVAAIICTVLLGSLTYAAWQFSQSRRESTLGREVTPQGWPISFRLSDAWRRVNEGAPDADRQIIYWNSEDHAVPSKLMIRRLPKSAKSSAQLCAEYFKEFFGVFQVAGLKYDNPLDVAPGQLEGSFLIIPDMGYAVFVGTWQARSRSDELWVLELVTPQPLWQPDVLFFRRFAESINPAG